MDPLLDLLTTAAARGALAFVVIGGRGLEAHGIQRFTRDIDIAIAAATLGSLREVLASAGYRVETPVGQFYRFRPDDPNLAPLDAMVVSDETFGKILASSVPFAAAGLPMRAPDLPTYIAMKLLSLRNQPDRAFKDAGDLDALVRAGRGALQEAELRALCDRYGTPDEAARLLAILRS